MEQQIPTSTTTSQPSEPPPPQSQPQPPPQPLATPIAQPLQPPSSTTSPTPTPTPTPSIQTSSNPNPNPNPTPNQNPNPNLKPSTTLLPHQPQPRPPTTFSRTPPQQQQQQHFPHFSSLPSSSSPASPSASPSVSTAPQPQRGGIAIGVPAHHSSPSPQPSPFPSSFGQHFTGLGRTALNVTDSTSNSNTSQLRPPMQGMGMLGSQMRPSGMPVHHQQRPVQPSIRPQSSPANQPSTSQNIQGHGLTRLSSLGSPGSPSPNTPQSMQSHSQPWLSSGSQGKPPLPSPPQRHQVNSQMQQRAHLPQQQHHHLATASPQQHMSSSQQQQPSPSSQPQEHYGQQFPPSRVPQSLPHPQQIMRIQGSGNQKPTSLAMLQPTVIQSGTQNRTPSTDTDESCNRILSKRSIHEIVSQIDPSEKLDPEVEDILVDIAEDFVDSITTFGCSLAKHRKSTTLDAKDILVHVERNWNITLPGFGADEIKCYRKPLTNDIHKERLAAIKKSIVATETATKNSGGQAAGTAKSNLAKTPASVIGSPNFKAREVT